MSSVCCLLSKQKFTLVSIGVAINANMDTIKTKSKQMSESERLKVRIKKWEKHFLDTNGRKPSKHDIDADPELKRDYKKYWSAVEKSNLSQVWNKGLNKSKSCANRTLNSEDSVLNSFSKKMLDKYLKNIAPTDKPSGNEFSFKKKLLKTRQQSLEQQRNRQMAGDQVKDSLEQQTQDSEPKLNAVLLRSKSIEESIVRSISKELNANNIKNNMANEENLLPMIDKKLINDLIERIDVNIDDKDSDQMSATNVVNETIDSGVGADSRSDSLSNDSLNHNYSEINCSKTKIKRKSDVFDFDDDNERQAKRRVYTDLESDFELSKQVLNSKQDVNILNKESDNSIEPKKKKFFVSSDRNKRLSSLNSYRMTMNSIINIDDENERTFVKDIKRTNEINKTDETQEVSPEEYNPTEPSKETKMVKTKAKRKKKPETNYKRIDLKRKVFARGYKKFNIKKYKRLKWKKNVEKNKNNCFKCGASGHWAKDCQFEDKLDSEVFEDELKGLGVSRAVEDLKQTIRIKPLLSEESEEPNDESIREALVILGHKEFRPNQEVIVKRILKGESSLMIASTGSGKSLCYQLPAYLYWKYRKAITLVISPLISLMEDQLTTFPRCLKAVCFHSGLSSVQKQSALDCILSGEAQVILLSPEAITGGNTCINLNSLPPIAFVCIDEAHCLSEWSNNFRPSYLQLYRVLRDKLKISTYLALTATATKKTSLTIARTLGLDAQSDIIGTTLVPENLILTASRDSNKELALIDLLKSERFSNLRSIIIYCTRREQTERLASLIRISFQEIRETNAKTGKSRIVWDAQAYHAGMTSEERNRVQKRFIKGDLRVIVATIAFGMGINKPDIRGIIHYNLPKSFENYMQEIGRAGRDGLEAHCHLFLDSDGSDLFELQRHIYANSTDRKCLRKLIEKVFRPCKCRTLYSDSEDDVRDVCVGHEVAFPIESTVLELDLKEETIMTLITYLELEFCNGKVELLAPINSMCTLLCYADGSQQMKTVAKLNPIVGIALALHQKKSDSQEVPNKLKFDLVEVSSMLGRAISEVRNELRRLEWQDCSGRPKRTNIRVMFSDLSFHLRSVGDLNEQQLNECLEFLHDLTQIQESNEVSKLRNVYLTFRRFSQTVCTNRYNQSQCLQLKQELNNYFNDSDAEHNIEINEQSFRQLFKGRHIYDLEQARRDVRDLLAIHGSQTLSSARAIARILQGIASPRFPAEVWGKVRRFWRSNINIDFNELLRIANEELLRLKSN